MDDLLFGLVPLLLLALYGVRAQAVNAQRPPRSLPPEFRRK